MKRGLFLISFFIIFLIGFISSNIYSEDGLYGEVEVSQLVNQTINNINQTINNINNFDQDLNTDNNTIFNSVNVSENLNVSGNASASWVNSLFNWTSISNFLSFNGFHLNFLDTPFNDTYDNRYTEVTGDTITGNLTLNEDLNFLNMSLKRVTTSSLVNGTTYGFFMDGQLNINMPHFWIQPGGSGQASGISRSFMIVNEVVALQNTINITSCQASMDLEGIARVDQIDCNTTTTGADLWVSDDFQVGGDVRVRDTQNETHFLSRELQVRDEMFRNITLTGINGTLVKNNLTINSIAGGSIVVNIDTSEKILTKSTDSILLTEGTNETPIFNQIYYNDKANPILAKRTTLSEEVPSVAAFMFGANFTYASIIGGTTANNFFRGNYNRWLDQGAIYKSGFDINVTTEEINFTTGVMKVLLSKLNINSNHSTSDFFVHVHTDGTFHQHTNLDDCSTYSGGESISNNKYFNLVCGIVTTHDEKGVMYCVTQDKPDSEHTRVIDAQLDVDFLRIFPPDDTIKLAYIPIVRAVVKRSGGDNTIQTLTTGNLFLDLRGTITANAGSTPSPSISSHSDLTISSLEFNESLHTFANSNQVLDIGSYNLTTTGNGTFDRLIARNWTNVSIKENQITDLQTYLLESNWNSTNSSYSLLSELNNGSYFNLDWLLASNWNSTNSSYRTLDNLTFNGNIVGGSTTGNAYINADLSGDQGAGDPTYSWVGNVGTGMRRPIVNTIAFDTGSSERMRIESDGDVGIGDASAVYRLDIDDTSDANFLQGRDSSHSCNFGVNGAGWVVNFCSSDERLKENITELTQAKIDYSADYVFNYPLKEYTTKSDGLGQVGAIAQDLQINYPEKVKNSTEAKGDDFGIGEYLGVIPPSNNDFILAFQKLKQENDLMKAELCTQDLLSILLCVIK